MSDLYSCPSCGFAGDYGEFQAHNGDHAPDLEHTGMCPQCDESVEDLEDWAQP